MTDSLLFLNFFPGRARGDVSGSCQGGPVFFSSQFSSSFACSKDVRLPVQLQRAMAAEAEAAREARAKVRFRSVKMTFRKWNDDAHPSLFS